MKHVLDTSLRPPLIGRAHAAPTLAESFHRIRTVLLSDGDAAPRSVLVASALHGDGRSTVAANLAIACSTPGRRVLLVDSDLRKPVQHSIFELENTHGLAQALSTEGNGELFVRQVRPSLDLLSSGPSPADPCELIDSDMMTRLLEFVRQMYDLVILDSPPIHEFADAVALARRVDAIVFVVRSSSTYRDEASRALKELSRANPRVLGAVLNAVPNRSLAGKADPVRLHRRGLPIAAKAPQPQASVQAVSVAPDPAKSAPAAPL